MDISSGVILVSTLFACAGSVTKTTFRCNNPGSNGQWVITAEGAHCSGETTVEVTRIFMYGQMCTNPMEIDSGSVYYEILGACNRKRKCALPDLKTVNCATNQCIVAEHKCIHASEEKDEDKSTDSTAYQPTTENVKEDASNDSTDTKLIIIAVVSVVALVATTFAGILCWLFVCCRKSSVYRGDSQGQAIQDQVRPGQQGEYANVDESRFQVGTPSQDSVGTTKVTFNQASKSHRLSDDDDYAEISSNESPKTSKRTSCPLNPAASTACMQSGCPVAIISSPGCLHQTDTCRGVSAHSLDCTREPVAAGLYVEYGNTVPSFGPHHLMASLKDHASSEKAASRRQEEIKTADLHQGTYSLASPPNSSSGRHVISEHCKTPGSGSDVIVGQELENPDYAHLSRPGNERINFYNVYDG